ncbi:hypothetical protein AC578_10332 [Pseudocercospora eumusae]|uniref:O-methyltransferase C-terminal domain-containing protein n=1 Tax=Pseudocercospora eumusae TaxID=321146 RepID=A0A139HRB4_9PEZI|nr:hypothetical protein AC578_10332 [Pseudocercospora eumusae]
MDELLDLLTQAEKCAEALGHELSSNLALQAQLLAKARSIIRKTQKPEQRLREIFTSPYHLACLQTAFDAGWLRSIEQAGSAGRTVAELATRSGADTTLVRQVLRYLAAHGDLREVAVDKYATTVLNSTLCTNDGLAGGLKHAGDAYAFSAAHMPDFLATHGYKYPADIENTPYAEGHGLSLFKDLSERPALGRAFNKYTATVALARRPWHDVFPITELHVDDDEVMLVDIGGGRGHELAALARKQLPGELVLQDLPEVIAQVPREWKSRFTSQAHDYFTPQPRKNVRAYYMRRVLCEYNDEKCTAILSHTRDAMKPDYSSLLINELVIPDTGCSPAAATFDLIMMTVLGARERTKTEWGTLIGNINGLGIKKIHKLEETGECIIEVCFHMAIVDVANLPPGTVRLIDVDGNLVAKHADGASEKDVVLHPTPSEDPEDPLNWSFRRKMLATSCVMMYTLMVAIPSGSVYSVVKPIERATGLQLNDLNTGTGVMFLAYGWACVVWQPLALQYGKRPAYLVSMAASIAIMGTAPLCTKRSTYLANKVLQGFFGAPVEALCEISLTDIWFAHERPKYLAWYGFGLSVTGKLAPMLAGFINDGQDWRWVLWWTAIWIGIAFVYCLFLMEETNYDRVQPAEHHATATEVKPATPSSTEEPSPVEKDLRKNTSVTTSSPPDTELGQTIPAQRKSYLQKLSLTGDKPRPNRMLNIFLAPFKGFTYPCIVYAGLMYGGNALVWSGVLNATSGTVYTTTYGFSTTAIAAAYSGGVAGAIIGAYYSGKTGRILLLRLARRRNGISEAEDTLWLFLASMLLVPSSILLYGLGVTYRIHWFALVFAQAALAVSNSLCVGAAINYAVACYPELSGDLITTLILIRNTLSFAVNFGITPWLEALGYRDTFVMVAVIGFFWNASLLLMVRVGPKLRRRSAERYGRDVARARAKGLGH